MHIIAVDPGLTSGYATYKDDKNFSYGQTQNSEYLLHWLDTVVMPGDVVIIENYLSAGHLTVEAKETIKLVGLLEGFVKWRFDNHVELVPPQRRLSAVTHATQVIGDHAKNLHRDGRDAIAALAHAISYARTNLD